MRGWNPRHPGIDFTILSELSVEAVEAYIANVRQRRLHAPEYPGPFLRLKKLMLLFIFPFFGVVKENLEGNKACQHNSGNDA